MENSVYIKWKREQLGLSTKEFADALGLGKDGNHTITQLEKGVISPSEDMLERIKAFASVRPYQKKLKKLSK